MTEVLWPPDLIPSSQSWTTIGNAATFNSTFVGTSYTYGRPGVRMGCTITLPPVKGEPRARMLAALRALKDRGNYIWVPDFTTTLETGLPVRGSFAATEVFANNNFASGTTGWTGTRCTLSVADRVLRLTNTKSGGADNFTVEQATLAVTQYAPYAVRAMISNLSRSGMSNGTNFGSSNYATDRAGLISQAAVQLSSTTGTVYPGVFDAAGSIALVGDYAELSWTSLARCMLVDNGPNALLQSDAFNTTWAPTRATITANSSVAPDGTTTGDTLSEDGTAANTHYVSQSVTVSASAAEYTFAVAVKASGRSWVAVTMAEATSGTEAIGYFDLSGGVVGSMVTGANWASTRIHIAAMGNGWYYCSVTARKTNAATSLIAGVYIAEGDGDRVFSGTSTASLLLWRGTMAASSAPVRLTQTTTTATAGTTQISNRLYVKGLPASTQNLLKAGDKVQIGGQINYVIAPLGSNAAGLGVLICGNPWRSPADNAPVIVNTPMCKMQLASDTIDVETGPGQFSPFMLELVEVIE
jgi:hypothetical protein